MGSVKYRYIEFCPISFQSGITFPLVALDKIHVIHIFFVYVDQWFSCTLVLSEFFFFFFFVVATVFDQNDKYVPYIILKKICSAITWNKTFWVLIVVLMWETL